MIYSGPSDDGWITVTWEDDTDDEVPVRLANLNSDGHVGYAFTAAAAETVDLQVSHDGSVWYEHTADIADEDAATIALMFPYVRVSGLVADAVFQLSYRPTSR